MNKQPQLLISHEDLSKIRFIVDLAPQEAQWFHRVQKVVSGSTISYVLSGMFIPEQTCSAAEVDTSPEMMVKFYKSLKEEYGDRTNDIMANMTCWCHSHHNMGVSPSGQDVKQFTEQITLAEKRGVALPQIMMIFNKKDQFYSRLWDPEENLMCEHLPIYTLDYDFSDLKKQAQAKFKKKKVFVPSVRGRNFVDMASAPWGQWSDEVIHTSKASPKGGAKKKESPKRKKRIQGVSSFEDEVDYSDLIEACVEEMNIPSLAALSTASLLNDIHSATYDVIGDIKNILNPNEIGCLVMLLDGSAQDIVDYEEFIPKFADNVYDHNVVLLYDLLSENCFVEKIVLTAISIAQLLCSDKIDQEAASDIILIWQETYNSIDAWI